MRETDPNKMSNTEWERWAEARIAELEAACEKAEYELDWHSDELRKLEMENRMLREALADTGMKIVGMLRGAK